MGRMFMALVISASLIAPCEADTVLNWKGQDGRWCLMSNHKSACLPAGLDVVEFGGRHAIFERIGDSGWRERVKYYTSPTMIDAYDRRADDGFSLSLSSTHEGATMNKYVRQDEDHPAYYLFTVGFDDGFLMLAQGLEDEPLEVLVTQFLSDWAAN